MKNFIKNYWKILLFFTLVGLIGGYFVGIYSFKSYSDELKQEMIAQGISEKLLYAVSAIQSAVYGLILGALGIFFSKKTGLWKDKLTADKKSITATTILTVLGGISFILIDVLIFAKFNEQIANSYLLKPTFTDILAMVLYGGVIEEVMLRLFFMSILAFIIHKIFEGKKQSVSTWVFIVSNVLSALLFALGHLPATASMMTLSPLIIFRCFLLNGAYGLIFGYLYRKYGIAYSMVSHAGFHLISKFIWFLFF